MDIPPPDSLGADIDDAGGDGPGSFDVRGNVWHLDCCNPQNREDRGWSIFGAIFGWTNSATRTSISPAGEHPVNLTVRLIQCSWICSWVRLLLDRRHRCSCLHE